MLLRTGRAVARPVRGLARAVRARPGLFAAIALAAIALQFAVPPLLLSAARGPWTYFAVNPWLKRLPEYLASATPLGDKLDFLGRVALFWFQADGPHGAPEWGFAVDTRDLARVLVTALLFAAYFALWAYRRPGHRRRAGARTPGAGGVLGAFASVFGLTTGPCSVVGCGAPVLPVAGLAFAGLSSGTLALLSSASRLATAALLVLLALAVIALGWRAGAPPHPTPVSTHW
jgi:hypothetical protein